MICLYPFLGLPCLTWKSIYLFLKGERNRATSMGYLEVSRWDIAAYSSPGSSTHNFFFFLFFVLILYFFSLTWKWVVPPGLCNYKWNYNLSLFLVWLCCFIDHEFFMGFLTLFFLLLLLYRLIRRQPLYDIRPPSKLALSLSESLSKKNLLSLNCRGKNNNQRANKRVFYYYAITGVLQLNDGFLGCEKRATWQPYVVSWPPEPDNEWVRLLGPFFFVFVYSMLFSDTWRQIKSCIRTGESSFLQTFRSRSAPQHLYPHCCGLLTWSAQR